MKKLVNILEKVFKNHSVNHMRTYAIRGIGIIYYKKETFINGVVGIANTLEIGRHVFTFTERRELKGDIK